MSFQAKAIVLAKHVDSGPVDTDAFTSRQIEVPLLLDGQATFRTLVLSVDPYMRGLFRTTGAHAPSFQIGEPLSGTSVSECIATKNPKYEVGKRYVTSNGPWQDRWNSLPENEPLTVVPSDISSETAVSVKLTGVTAYVGLIATAGVKPGDVVLVSAAAGATGSAVVQLARIRGASRVIGIAGGPAKVDYLLKELKCDSAIDYHEYGSDVDRAIALIKAAAPNGCDVYFDCTGGVTTYAALSNMKIGGRMASCGAISTYDELNSKPGPAEAAIPQPWWLILSRALRVQGFHYSADPELAARATQELYDFIRQGRFKDRHTVYDGLDRAGEAFVAVMSGKNLGKMLVRL